MEKEKFSLLNRKIKEIAEVLENYIRKQEDITTNNRSKFEEIERGRKSRPSDAALKIGEGLGTTLEAVGFAAVGKILSGVTKAVASGSDETVEVEVKSDDFISYVKRKVEQQSDLSELKIKLNEVAQILDPIHADRGKNTPAATNSTRNRQNSVAPSRSDLTGTFKKIRERFPGLRMELNAKTGEVGLTNAIISSWISINMAPGEIWKIREYLTKSIATLRELLKEIKELQDKVESMMPECEELENGHGKDKKSAVCIVM